MQRKEVRLVIKVESDFSDYYDELSSDNTTIVYKRFKSQSMSRAEALTYLKNNGINTVKYGPFIKFTGETKKFVVYTNQASHDFKGKLICTFDKVASEYSNYLVSEFLSSSNGLTIKYLQIGERRFRMMFSNPEFEETLKEGSLVQFDELPKGYNHAIGLPIYSIDYISNGLEMLAIDFNQVQNLQKIGIDKIITADEVITQVENALIAYNKA